MDIIKKIKEEDIILNLIIKGEPKSASRPRFSTHPFHVYMPEDVKKYQQYIYFKIKEKLPNTPPDEFNSFGLYVKFYRSNRQRIDIDNLIKCLMDGITLAKVWKDDAQLQELYAEKFYKQKIPRVEFILFKIPLNIKQKTTKSEGHANIGR